MAGPQRRSMDHTRSGPYTCSEQFPNLSEARPMANNPQPRNVLGDPLEPCGIDPPAGFHRTGRCETDVRDLGNHSVCAEVTQAFLAFTAEQGNDLAAPVPAFAFPGLAPGDRWCLCAARWQEAFQAGHAPPVRLASTEENALEVVRLADLRAYAIDG